MPAALIRAGVWGGVTLVAVLAANAGAVEALTQPVTMPFWLVAVFLMAPTESFAALSRSVVTAANRRVKNESRPRT